ncbi:hypothetical protein Gpo141_00006298 [Globisporangium polare]
MVNPLGRLTARLFDSKAPQSALPALQPSELAVVMPSPLPAVSASTWSSLFKKTKSRNRTQSEKLEAAPQRNGSRRATLFRRSDPQQPNRRWAVRKANNDERDVKDEKKKVQFMSAEMQIQIAQLVLGYA